MKSMLGSALFLGSLEVNVVVSLHLRISVSKTLCDLKIRKSPTSTQSKRWHYFKTTTQASNIFWMNMDLLLPVLLKASDVELEEKTEGTLRNAY